MTKGEEIVREHQVHSVVVRAEQLAAAIDAALSERDVAVRECLEGLRNGMCWCDAIVIEPIYAHSKACRRAREVYESLKIEALEKK